MNGIIVQFRRGRHRIHERHYLLDVGLQNRDEAQKIVGKKVRWKSSSGKIITGEVRAPHGTKGLVRAIFERGLPGQAITNEVELMDAAPIVKQGSKK